MKRFLTLIAVFLLFFCNLTQASFWQQRQKNKNAAATDIFIPAISPSQNNPLNTQFGLEIPNYLGQITQSYFANTPQSKKFPLIVHIQDAHGHYNAQKNSAAILKILAQRQKQKNLSPLFVGVEGAWKNIDLSYLTVYPDAAARRQASESLLQKNQITGEEYLAINEDIGLLEIQGIEDAQLYDANLKSRQRMNQERPDLIARFKNDEQRLANIKKISYSPALLQFDQNCHLYADNKLDLKTFTQYLKKFPAYKSAFFPNLKKFATVADQEKTTDVKTIQTESQKLIQLLQQQNNTQLLNNIAQKALNYRLGTLAALDYYQSLLAAASKLNFAMPQTQHWLDYLKESQQIDTQALLTELRQAQNLIFADFTRQEPNNALLIHLTQELDWEKKFWNESLSLEEWLEYEKSGFNYLDLEKQLAQYEQRLGLKVNLYQPDKQRIAARKSFPLSYREMKFLQQAYYKLAVKRDQVMAQNCLKKIDYFIRTQQKKRPDYKPEMAVLIAGGFHSSGIGQHLKSKGLSYIVIRSNLTHR